MSALTINPTAKEVREVYRKAYYAPVPNPDLLGVDAAHLAVFQAGVEAERARAAAETTEEWAIENRYGLSPQASETEARRKMEQHGQNQYGAHLLRRLVGPWEVQS